MIGGGLTLDLDKAAFFAVVLTENVSSLVIAHPPPPDRHGSFILFLTQGGAGNYEVAWPATVRWGISGPPTAKQVGLTTVLYFSTPDGGVPWYAFLCGLFI